MKDKQLQTKRKAKSGFRALYAKTLERKQRASTAAASPDEIEGDIPKVGIGRALTVILVLHIVAIAAIYMGTKWKGPEEKASNALATMDDKDADTSSVSDSDKLHKFRVGQPPSYRNPQVTNSVSTPSSNNNSAGAVIPPPKQVNTPPVQQSPVRQPRVIRPKRNPNAYVNQTNSQDAAQTSVRYKVHTIASGDTIYRLALRNKVKQQAILDLNNIADARKIRVGMKIKIPVQ